MTPTHIVHTCRYEAARPTLQAVPARAVKVCREATILIRIIADVFFAVSMCENLNWRRCERRLLLLRNVAPLSRGFVFRLKISTTSSIVGGVRGGLFARSNLAKVNIFCLHSQQHRDYCVVFFSIRRGCWSVLSAVSIDDNNDKSTTSQQCGLVAFVTKKYVGWRKSNTRLQLGMVHVGICVVSSCVCCDRFLLVVFVSFILHLIKPASRVADFAVR